MNKMLCSNTAALNSHIHADDGGEQCSLCHEKHYGKRPEDDPEGYCCTALKCLEWFGAACLEDREKFSDAGVFRCAVCGDLRCAEHVEQTERDAGACWDCMAERAADLNKRLADAEACKQSPRDVQLWIQGGLREARATRATFAIGGGVVGFLLACLLIFVAATG